VSTRAMSDRVLVTGAGGYLGVPVCLELMAAGWQVRGIDVLLHGQTWVRSVLERARVELIVADVRDSGARDRALDGARAVVHLAAIVGDPACACDPTLSHETNIDASMALMAAAQRAGVDRFVFASTCSNYGRMADPTLPLCEDAPLAPLSLYAEQKVHVERALLGGAGHGLHPTCLRFATIYGVAPRMRFDLTINQFTLELWADRTLAVYGERFWRPYVHVGDAARAVRLVLDSPLELIDRQVFNVGHSDENYTKLDIVEQIRRHISTGAVRYVPRDEDPRDYKVSFERIRDVLGFGPETTVADGIVETVSALSRGEFEDPFASLYRNVP
jgi:nucleoside-diphosphate-sugar epimerase